MINAEIIDYVKKQIQAGVSQDKIKSDLQSTGWIEADINEAIKISTTPVAVTSPVVNTPPATNPVESVQTKLPNSFIVNKPLMVAQATSPIKKSIDFIMLIIWIVIFIAFAGGGVFAYMFYQNNIAPKPNAPTFNNVPANEVSKPAETTNTTATTTVENPIITATSTLEKSTSTVDSKSLPKATTTSTKTETPANVSSATTDLWPVFDKLLLALKNKDISAYNMYSYRAFDPGQESEFIQGAPIILEMLATINKSDYVNKWQDDKQAIYSTNLKQDNQTDSFGYKKGLIKFVKKDGIWKIIPSLGEQSWGVTAITTMDGPKRTQAEADKELSVMTLDTDKDGLTDNEETCSGAKQFDKQCVKTDPNKKDTNGDGWWDGIEAKL